MTSEGVQPPYALYAVEVTKAELVTPRLKRLTVMEKPIIVTTMRTDVRRGVPRYTIT